MSAPGAQPPHLRRARDPQGREHWIWHQDGADYSIALGAELADAARWLLAWRPGSAPPGPPAAASSWTLLRPGRPGKGLAIGKNFAAHAREFGSEPPEELIWFPKLPDVLIGPGEPVMIPTWLDTRVDPEAEVVALVGAPLSGASEAQAAAAIAAYTLGNDVTARKQQGLDRQRGWPWLRSKNLATFGPIGPWWVPVTAVTDLGGLSLRGLVNGEVRQEALLRDMIWSPGAALSEISRWTPLQPGDIVFLGTPAGVAAVQPGDVMRVEVDGIGALESRVLAGPPGALAPMGPPAA